MDVGEGNEDGVQDMTLGMEERRGEADQLNETTDMKLKPERGSELKC